MKIVIIACFCLFLFSGLLFGWMTPLMTVGYKKPITDKDVWKLDSWDQTETLYGRYVTFLLLVQ